MAIGRLAVGAVVLAAAGVGVLLLAPRIARAAQAARPAATVALAQAMAAAQRGRNAVAGVWEDLEDALAEARAGRAARQEAAAETDAA